MFRKKREAKETLNYKESNEELRRARATSCSWMKPSPQCDQFSSSHRDDANRGVERKRSEARAAHIDLDFDIGFTFRRPTRR